MQEFRPKFIYIFDALCPWCHAFTPVVQALVEGHREAIDVEVLSGGLVLGDRVRTVGPGEPEALRESYRAIEDRSGANFGAPFFEALAAGERRLDSLPAAIALAAFRSCAGDEAALDFAHALLGGIFVDGEDPTDPDFHIRLAAARGLDPRAFGERLRDPAMEDAARYDFALAKQLGAEAFPRLYLQTAEDYFHLVARGYAERETVERIVGRILASPEAP